MNIMKKGMTGETVRTVFLLVIAVIAFVILYLFFSGQLKYVSFGLNDITEGFRNWFCKDFLGGIKGFACEHL